MCVEYIKHITTEKYKYTGPLIFCDKYTGPQELQDSSIFLFTWIFSRTSIRRDPREIKLEIQIQNSGFILWVHPLRYTSS